MKRQGWTALEPWVWEHPDDNCILYARPPSQRGNVAPLARRGRTVCVLYPKWGRAPWSHTLRDAWRSQQWREFQDSGTKAAHAAPEVAERAVVVPKACDRAPPTLRPHARAVAVGHWASHARTRRMRIGSMSGPARRCALAPCPYPITHSSGLWGGKLQTQASFTSWQGYRKGFSLCDTRVLRNP